MSKKEYFEDLASLLNDPAGREMIKESMPIPSGQALDLLEDEISLAKTTQGEEAIVRRISLRMGLEKLVKSHTVTTNFLLRLAIELKVKLKRTTYKTGENGVEFSSSDLEIDPDGIYSDPEIADITALCIKKIRAIIEVEEKRQIDINRLEGEKASLETNKREEKRKYEDLLTDYRSQTVPNESVFLYQDLGDIRYYLAYNAESDEFHATTHFKDAYLFKDREKAFDKYVDVLSQTRNYKTDDVPKIWNYKPGVVKVQSNAWESFGDSSIFALNRAREDAESFENFESSIERDAEKAKKLVNELEGLDLMDPAIIDEIGDELGIPADIEVDMPKVKPKAKEKRSKPATKNAGKLDMKQKRTGKSKIDLSAFASSVNNKRKVRRA